jgi:rSAM/selenodomain-associated transferase 1
MAKLPVAGRVKTRLCPPLTSQEAADLHERFLKRLLTRLAADHRWRVVWCYAGATDAQAADFARTLPGVTLSLLPQSGGDLGDRLIAAAAVQEGPLAFFGADSPHLPDGHLVKLYDALARGDASIGPCDDGGFWCLGLPDRHVAAKLLTNVRWSSGHELSDVRRHAEEAGVRLVSLPTFWDVDRPEDLARLRASLPAAERSDWLGDLNL